MTHRARTWYTGISMPLYQSIATITVSVSMHMETWVVLGGPQVEHSPSVTIPGVQAAHWAVKGTRKSRALHVVRYAEAFVCAHMAERSGRS